jgi:hypothetical protein
MLWLDHVLAFEEVFHQQSSLQHLDGRKFQISIV